MATAGKVTIDLVARTAKLEAGIQRTKRKMQGLQRSVRSLQRAFRNATTRIAKWGAALGIAAAVGVAAVIRSQLQLIDTLDKTSRKLGIAAGELQGLRLAAELTGVPIRQLDLGIQRMTRRVAEAAIGMGEAQQAIKDLGLDAKKLASLPLEQQMQALAGAFEAVENSGERVRLGFKLFDSEGVALINLLAIGQEGLKDISQEAKDLGLAMSSIEIAQVVKAKDAFTRLGAVVTGLKQKITIALAPSLIKLADSLRNNIGVIKTWTIRIAKTAAAIVILATALKAVQFAFRGVAASMVIVKALSGPVGLAQLAIALAVTTTALLAVSAAFNKIDAASRGALATLGQFDRTASVKVLNVELEDTKLHLADLQTELSRGFDMLEASQVLPLIKGISAAKQRVVDLQNAISKASFVAEESPFGAELETIVLALEKQKRALDTASQSARINELAILGARDAVVAYARQLEQDIAVLKLDGDTKRLTESLQRQIDTFGMSANAIAVWELRMRGASETTIQGFIDQQRELMKLVDEQKKANSAAREAETLAQRLKDRAASIFDATRTPLEMFTEKIRELKELLTGKLIDDDTFARALKQAEDTLAAATKATKVAAGGAKQINRRELRGLLARLDRNFDNRDIARKSSIEVAAKMTPGGKQDKKLAKEDTAKLALIALQKIETHLNVGEFTLAWN